MKNIWSAIKLCYFLILPFEIYAQDNRLEWVNNHANELTTDTGLNDLKFLSKKLAGKTIVGLGEASHGTQEFYFQKSRIVRYLVNVENFRLIAFEAPANYIEPINNYIQKGEGDLKDMLVPLGLYNSDGIYKLVEWLKAFNLSKPANEKVRIIGFDDEDYWGDPLNRDELMAQNFIGKHKVDTRKSILWSHNLHIAKDTTMAQYKAMGFHIRKAYGNDFYAVGFDTFRGSVNVLSDGQFESHDFGGIENTIAALFSKAKFSSFFIDFQDVSNPFANNTVLISNFYSNWRDPQPLPIAPGRDFDALIFIRETTASKAVQN